MSTSDQWFTKVRVMSDLEKVAMVHDAMQAAGRVATNAKITPERAEQLLKESEAETGIPYEHLCRLASVVREIYRARVEGVR